MPLNSIIIIVLRLFALNWLVYDVTFWAQATLTALSPARAAASLSECLTLFAAPFLLLLTVMLLWCLAGLIARLISPDGDVSVDLTGLTLYHLYCFGFVFLGLYFVLSSFADVINWTHYFALRAHNSSQTDTEGKYLYQTSRPALTFVGGLISLLGAPRWAKKLLRREEKMRSVDGR